MTDTVLVTGISGFIAKHIALALLNAGYHVRGTVRDIARADDVKQTLSKHGGDIDRLTICQANLENDSGWKEAIDGCAYIQHVASPFPITVPNDRESLVPAAKDGALRVIEASLLAGAERIVMTSSMVAMMYRPDRPAVLEVNENDWTDPEWPPISAYIVSKMRAEQAVWDRVDGDDKERLCTINPGFVLGPALDEKLSTSLEVIRLMLAGAYPALPPISFPIVDVRDLAALHLAAMTSENVAGRRLVAAGETVSMRDIAAIIRNVLPAHAKKVPHRELPIFLVRFIALFDRQLRSVVNDLGIVPRANSEYVTELTGIPFRSAHEAIVSAANSLIEHHLV